MLQDQLIRSILSGHKFILLQKRIMADLDVASKTCVGYTVNDLFGEGSLHDYIQSTRNKLLQQKGLNPSNQEDIASLTSDDYLVYFRAISDS